MKGFYFVVFVASYFIFHDSDFLSHQLANLATAAASYLLSKNNVRVGVQSVAQPLWASVRSEHWLVWLSLKNHPQIVEAVLINQCTLASIVKIVVLLCFLLSHRTKTQQNNKAFLFWLCHCYSCTKDSSLWHCCFLARSKKDLKCKQWAS